MMKKFIAKEREKDHANLRARFYRAYPLFAASHEIFKSIKTIEPEILRTPAGGAAVGQLTASRFLQARARMKLAAEIDAVYQRKKAEGKGRKAALKATLAPAAYLTTRWHLAGVAARKTARVVGGFLSKRGVHPIANTLATFYVSGKAGQYASKGIDKASTFAAGVAKVKYQKYKERKRGGSAR